MTKLPNSNLKHACGQCGQIFSSETEYLRHHCTLYSAPVAVPKLSENDILAAVLASRQDKKDRG